MSKKYIDLGAAEEVVVLLRDGQKFVVSQVDGRAGRRDCLGIRGYGSLGIIPIASNSVAIGLSLAETIIHEQNTPK